MWLDVMRFLSRARDLNQQGDEARDGDGEDGRDSRRSGSCHARGGVSGVGVEYGQPLQAADYRMLKIAALLNYCFCTTERSGGFRRRNAVWLVQTIPGYRIPARRVRVGSNESFERAATDASHNRSRDPPETTALYYNITIVIYITILKDITIF